MSAIICIPCRMESSRLPGKPLLHVHGNATIHYPILAAERSKRASAGCVISDGNRALEFYCMGRTGFRPYVSPEAATGSDRIASVLNELPAADFIVNLQADELDLTGDDIDAAIEYAERTGADFVTAVGCETMGEDANESYVVAEYDPNSLVAMDFIRGQVGHYSSSLAYRQHVGLYVYRREALERYHAAPRGEREVAESLEQLRVIERGLGCWRVGVTIDRPTRSINTPEDLAAANATARS